MRNVLRVLLSGFAMLAAVSANAAFIDGSTMTLAGDYSTSPINATDLTTVTAVTLSTVGTAGAATDTFSETIGAFTGDEAGLYTTASLSTFSPINNFLTFAGWQLDLATLTVEGDSTSGFLHLSGAGVVSGNGHQATGASWSFSAHNANQYSMSVTASVVPVPAAAWLFGSGLIGLVGVARRKI